MTNPNLLAELCPGDLKFLLPRAVSTDAGVEKEISNTGVTADAATPPKRRRRRKEEKSNVAEGGTSAPTPASSGKAASDAASPSTSMAEPSLAALSAQEHPLPSYAATESVVDVIPRRRQRVEHVWPAINSLLTAEYFGQTYEAKVIPATKRLKSGKQLLLLNGPAQGQIHDSYSEAMLAATAEQRQREHRHRQGVSNGWSFWAEKRTVSVP